jgi:putative transposase
MTENRHPVLSLAQQCQLLKISRSSLYDKPAGESALNVSLMRTMGSGSLGAGASLKST